MYDNRENNNGQNIENQGENTEYVYTIVDKKGKPKTLGWSVASLVCGILSMTLFSLGWAGIIIGVAAIVLSIIARVKLGYFSGMAIAGLLTGIFGAVFGIGTVIVTAISPDFFDKLLESLSSSSGTNKSDINNGI